MQREKINLQKHTPGFEKAQWMFFLFLKEILEQKRWDDREKKK